MKALSAVFVCFSLLFTACDLFTANMSEFVEKYSNNLYVTDWEISPLSEIIPTSEYNDRRNLVIEASASKSFIVDLELDNPEGLSYIVEAESADGGGVLFLPAFRLNRSMTSWSV